MPGKMNPEIKAQWVADLRSGEFAQGKGYLNSDGKLCCLGVLCEQAVKAGVIDMKPSNAGYIWYDDKNDVLSEKVRAWAGLPGPGDDTINPNNPKVTVDDGAASLAELNDGENGWERRTFEQIADLIDAQL